MSKQVYFICGVLVSISLATLQLIYDHASAARKEGHPGGPDEYRSLRYTRDDAAGAFTSWMPA
jgi:hypothetical protein